ncbi:MAG: hypothetical protein NVS4B5_18130 [Vulcanimicrobiaceae bacterium]
MPVSAFAGLVFGVSALALGLYHLAFVGPRLRALATLMAGGAAGLGVSPLATNGVAASASAGADERIAEIERTLKRDLHRVGFLRYNSFSDVGSDLSFTLALLNDAGDGVVVTSIYSREETRTYGKAVRKFVPQQGASKEEQSAIAMARTGVGV